MAKDIKTFYARNILHREATNSSRDFRFEKGGFDAAKRTAVVSFSSEFPVRRIDFSGREFFEVLDHESVDMSRITDGAAVLYGHREHIGVVDAAAIGPDKRGRAIIRFSSSKLGEEKMNDVRDNILTKTSVGYDLGNAEYVVDGEREGIPVYRFRNWQPYEVTLCPTGADPTVGLGRSQQSNSTAVRSAPATKNSMTEEEKAAALAAEQQRAKAAADATVTGATAERARIADLNKTADQLATRHPQHKDALLALARKCGETGDGVDVFNRSVLADILTTPGAASPGATRQTTDGARIGLTAKDVAKYSILRAIRAKMDGRPLDGCEREYSDEIAKKLGRQPTGFFMPDEVVAATYHKRTLLAGNATDGGYTVPTEILTSEFMKLLRNNTRVIELGARFLSGLQGDVSIPRQLTGTTAYWVSETGSITASSATFGQVVGKPRRIGTSVPYSKQFLAQSSLDAEAFVIEDADLAIAVELDRVAIAGSGGAQPLGILNLASADLGGTVTFGAAPTWAKYLEFFSDLATANSLLGTPAYLTTPASAAKAMSIPKFSNTATPIWDNDKVGAFRALWSTNFPSGDKVIFGDFSQVLFLEWAGRDVIVDPYGTNATNGTVTVTIQRLIDMVIRRSASFDISTDSGAQ